jgi:hypothetical protein
MRQANRFKYLCTLITLHCRNSHLRHYFNDTFRQYIRICLIDCYFTGTQSKLSGISIDQIDAENKARQQSDDNYLASGSFTCVLQ